MDLTKNRARILGCLSQKSVNIIASPSITGKMTLEFTALSITVADIFWLVISLEEKQIN